MTRPQNEHGGVRKHHENANVGQIEEARSAKQSDIRFWPNLMHRSKACPPGMQAFQREQGFMTRPKRAWRGAEAPRECECGAD